MLFCREKKLVKLRKLHHDKNINRTCLHYFLKMAPEGIKFMPSSAILKVVQKSRIYIFVMK